MNSSLVTKWLSTHQKQITTCSLFDISIVSSTIIVRKGAVDKDWTICHKTCNDMTLRTSFCISGAIYLSVFFSFQLTSRMSSSLRTCKSWLKFESDSSPWRLKGSPCQARNLIFERILRKHWRRSNFYCWCIVEIDFLTSLVVEGNVITLKVGSLWQMLEECILNLVEASLQLW